MVLEAIIGATAGLIAADKGISYQKKIAAKMEAEARANKKAALKSLAQAYHRGSDDIMALFQAGLKTSGVKLYGAAGGTATANQQRGMYRQAGQAIGQLRQQEARDRASIEQMSTFNPDLYAGIGEAISSKYGAIGAALGDIVGAYANTGNATAQRDVMGRMPGAVGGSYRGPDLRFAPGTRSDLQAPPVGGPGPSNTGPHLGTMVSYQTPQQARFDVAMQYGGNLLSRIGGGFSNLFSSIFSGPTYAGYGGQQYYSNASAYQSQPVGGTNGVTWTPGV